MKRKQFILRVGLYLILGLFLGGQFYCSPATSTNETPNASEKHTHGTPDAHGSEETSEPIATPDQTPTPEPNAQKDTAGQPDQSISDKVHQEQTPPEPRNTPIEPGIPDKNPPEPSPTKETVQPDKPQKPKKYEGFGAVTKGGASGDIFYVTTLADKGKGSLREALLTRQTKSGQLVPRIVDFSKLSKGGTISLQSALEVKKGSLTIDGATAPSPGITIAKVKSFKGTALLFEKVSDIIVTHIRVKGHGCNCAGDNISLAGVKRAVIDHVSSAYSDDGAIDIAWEGGSSDITISWSLLYKTDKAMLIKYGPHRRISIHHNIFARNTERNPQLRHENNVIDFANNIVYHWAEFDTWGYGMLIYGQDKAHGNGLVDINVRSNVFIPGKTSPGNAITFGKGQPGKMYFHDNIFPPKQKAPKSTINSPLPIPSHAQVQLVPAKQLVPTLLPGVGMKYRNPEESKILSEIKGKAP